MPSSPLRSYADILLPAPIFSALLNQRAAACGGRKRQHCGPPPPGCDPPSPGGSTIQQFPALQNWRAAASPRRRPALFNRQPSAGYGPESNSFQLGKTRVGDTLLSQILSARQDHSLCPEQDSFGSSEPSGPQPPPAEARISSIAGPSTSYDPSIIFRHLRISRGAACGGRKRQHCGPPRPQTVARRAPGARLYSSFWLCKSRRTQAPDSGGPLFACTPQAAGPKIIDLASRSRTGTVSTEEAAPQRQKNARSKAGRSSHQKLSLTPAVNPAPYSGYQG